MGAWEGRGVSLFCLLYAFGMRASLCVCVCMSFGFERMSSMNKTKPTSILFLSYF